MDISIIVPLLNEEESLPELEAWIRRVMEQNSFSYEIVFVDDGSTDGSWSCIQKLKKNNDNVRGIRFRRNYGKSAALNEGFDLVSGWKKVRYDSKLTKNIPSKFYNWSTRMMTGIKLHDFNCGLKAYRNEVVKNIEIYGEMHRYIPVIAKAAGFSHIGERVVHHQKRKFGTSKFGMNRFIRGYLDLLTITFISKFGKRPMHLFGGLGTIMFLVGFIIGIILVVKKFAFAAYGMTNRPLFYFALICIILGVQLFLTGFLAELIQNVSSKQKVYGIAERL